jgi:hypothetical protein
MTVQLVEVVLIRDGGRGVFRVHHQDPIQPNALWLWPRARFETAVRRFVTRAAIEDHLEREFGYGLSRAQLDRLWHVLDERFSTATDEGYNANSWLLYPLRDRAWWKIQLQKLGYVPGAGGNCPPSIHVPSPPFHVGGPLAVRETPEQQVMLRGDPEPPPIHLGTARSRTFTTNVHLLQGIDELARRVGDVDPSIRPAVKVEPPAPPRAATLRDWTDEELEDCDPDAGGEDDFVAAAEELSCGLDQVQLEAIRLSWDIYDTGIDDRFRGWVEIGGVDHCVEFIRVVEDGDATQRPENAEHQADYDSLQEYLPGKYPTFEVPDFRGRYIALDLGCTV